MTPPRRKTAGEKRVERRVRERRIQKAVEEQMREMYDLGILEDRRKADRPRRQDDTNGIDAKMRQALGDRLPDRRRQQR